MKTATITNRYYIYELLDPRGLPNCYVGSTHDPKKRLQGFLTSPPSKVTQRWVKELKQRNLSPVMVILESDIPESEIIHAEEDAIAMVKAIRGMWCMNKMLSVKNRAMKGRIFRRRKYDMGRWVSA